jgi:hypothetical protein
MDMEMMMDEHPYKSILEMNKGFKMSLVKREWLPSVRYLQNSVSPA